MNLNCLVIDDELAARKVIIRYITKIPFLTLIESFDNAIEAVSLLNKTPIDIIFLDIEMPGLSGLDFIKTLSNRPHIILTTAYREFAIEGFELNVSDYLLKPISFERFLISVNRIQSNDNLANQSSLPDFAYFKSGTKNIQIYFDDILFIEALGNYVKIFCKDKIVTTYDQLKNLIIKLPKGVFVRVHKSYIVSIDKIETYGLDYVEINSHQITIGNTYKEDFLEVMSKYNK